MRVIDILIACLYVDARKLQQLRNETQALGNTLEQHIYHVSRREVEARERESLLNRRNGQGFDGSNSAMYASQESASLQNSSQMVSELTMLSQSILGDLGDQRNRMKVGWCLIFHSLCETACTMRTKTPTVLLCRSMLCRACGPKCWTLRID